MHIITLFQTRRWFALGAVATAVGIVAAACSRDSVGAVDPGDDGTNPPSITDPPNPTTTPDDPDAASDAGPAPGRDGGLRYEPVIPGPDAADTFLVCTRNEVIFDFSAFGLDTSGMPSAFVTAWQHEFGTYTPGSAPSFVLLGNGFATGPVTAIVGGARYSSGQPVLAPIGEGSSPIPLSYDSARPRRLMFPRTFLTTTTAIYVGAPSARRAIPISGLSFDLEVDVGCTQATGTITFEVSSKTSNADLIDFGAGTTLQQVLGPFTVDTDFDGTKDGWQFSISSSMAQPAPAILLSH